MIENDELYEDVVFELSSGLSPRQVARKHNARRTDIQKVADELEQQRKEYRKTDLTGVLLLLFVVTGGIFLINQTKVGHEAILAVLDDFKAVYDWLP